MKSDPICSSAGCDQYLHPEDSSYKWPKNYHVPDFGMDRDIYDTLSTVPVAEGLVRHSWSVTDQDLEREREKRKDIAMYDFNPQLDHNIVVS